VKRLNKIEVKQTGRPDQLEFEVLVSDTNSRSRHHVTMTRQDHDRFGEGNCPPNVLIESAFRFLLDREPKEAILSRFDVSVIPRYFPEFELQLPRYIAACSAKPSSNDGS
jgi:hypothetical protein